MVRKTVILGILLVLMVTLTACSGIPFLSKGGSGTDTPDAMPAHIQLLVGTLLLEETPNAVTAEQAQELLPLWQMLRSLQQSGTASQMETDAVLNQIRAAMTPEQLAAIKDKQLSPTSMRDMAQDQGLGGGEDEDEASSGGPGGGFGPPGGMGPPGGGGAPGGMMMPGGGMDLSPEEQATAIAERMSSGFGLALMDRLIEVLEARAGQEAEAVTPKLASSSPSSPPASRPTPTVTLAAQTPTATPTPTVSPSATATPAPTQAPTERPTVIVAATPTIMPPATATPAPTEGPSEAKVTALVVARGLNVRSGPDTAYPGLGHLRKGDEAEVIGFHPDSGWLQIVFEEAPLGRGWISGKAAYVTVTGSLDALPVVEVPPWQPTPAPVAEQAALDALPAAVEEATPQPTPAPVVEQATPEALSATSASLEGKLVFQTSSGGDIYTINVDGTNLTYLTHGLDPAWSPDGSQVAFTRWYHTEGGIYVINADGSGERLIFADPQAKAPIWSPDGTRIAFTYQHGGHLTNWKKCRTFTPPGASEPIRFCFEMPADPWWKLGVVHLEDGRLDELYCHNYSYSPTWSPDGTRIAYASDQGLALTWEGATSAVSRDPNTGALSKNRTLDRSPEWSPDGTRIVFQFRSHDHYEIVVMNADGAGRTQLTRNPPLNDRAINCVSPAWSSDGKYIVYLTDEKGPQEWEFYVMNADGSEQRPMFEAGVLDHLTFEYNNVDERVVSWGSCPGGCQATAEERATAIALMTATPWTPTPTPILTTPTPTPTFAPPTPVPTPTFVPTPPLEGKLVFRAAGGEIYTIQADGTNLTRLTDGLDPAWSPDGSQVAFARWSDQKGVYIVNADGGGESLIYGWDEARTPDWSPAGTSLVFTRQYGQDPESISKISVFHLESGQFMDLFSQDRSYSPAWSPDGSRLVYASDRGLHWTSTELSAQAASSDPAGLSLASKPGDGAPAGSPDGQRVAFHTWQHDHYEICVMNSDGSGRLRLTESSVVAARSVNSASPTWVGNDHIAYLTDRSGSWELYIMRADGSGQRVMFETALEGLTFDRVSLFDRVLDWTP